MIIDISARNGKKLNFDVSNPPFEDTFEELLCILPDSDVKVSMKHEIAYAYRKYPHLAKRILQQLESFGTPDENNKTKLLLLACQLQLGVNCVDLVKKIEPLNSPVFDILKGFLALKKKHYDNASFLFKKAKYQLGIQICGYYLNDFDEAKRSSNEVLRAYCFLKEGHTQEAAESFKKFEKKDILFKLGFCDEYENPECLDVKIALAERLVNDCKFSEAIEMLEKTSRNAETLYLRGKIEHKRENFDDAKKLFLESLEQDREYFRSEYCLWRIVQKGVREVPHLSEEFSDFVTYIELKEKNKSVNFSRCSREFRNVVSVIVEENGMKGGLRKYMNLVGNPWIDEFVVLNNISYFLCRCIRPFCRDEEEETRDTLLMCPINSIENGNRNLNYFFEGAWRDRRVDAKKYLTEALEKCPDEYQSVVKYNLAYVSEDLKILKELPLKEAEMLTVNLIREDESFGVSMEPDMIGYHHMKRGEFELAKKAFQEVKSLYSYICLGNIHLRDFFESSDTSNICKAAEAFSRGLKSYYCANGIGICFAQKNELEEAIGIFSSVATDWPGAYVNLGNALALSGKYDEAVKAFLNVPSMKYSREMLVRICSQTKSIECCRLCVSGGIKELNIRLFELLVDSGRLEEAGELEIKDERLLRMYEKKKSDEKKRQEELKKKVDEINEYRRKRNKSS